MYFIFNPILVTNIGHYWVCFLVKKRGYGV